jgi:hypothetical protein
MTCTYINVTAGFYAYQKINKIINLMIWKNL